MPGPDLDWGMRWVETPTAKEQPPPKEKERGLWEEVAFNLNMCSQAKGPV